MTFCGGFGITIIPDDRTSEKSISLSNELTPNAEFRVQSPHITLYHAKLINLPENLIKKTLLDLKSSINSELTLKEIVIYGGKFIFWNNIKTQILKDLHLSALNLSKYVDKNQTARAIEEELLLSSQEKINIEKYGYPLVNNLFMPHIAISWSKNLKLKEAITPINWSMTIKEIAFIETKEFGSINRIIYNSSEL